MSNLHYFHPQWIQPSAEALQTDICVYGGTAAGVAAAVAAARAGRSALLLHPGLHLGGMTSGGLTNTDIGNKFAIGGWARSIYRELGAHYGQEEAWRFEPGVVERLFERHLEKAGVPVHRAAFLDEVETAGTRIRRITCLGGLQVAARVFIDATYEGDLMARAGVSYATGREGNAVYGETHNGVQIHQTHQFDNVVDPYVTPGDAASGRLPWVNETLAPIGSGDHRVQAYNFRMCMTNNPAKRVAFPRPAGYRDSDYELCARWLAGTEDNIFRKFDMVTADKTDTNNHGAASTDFIGANYGWPDGSYEEREAIFQAHVTYQQGLHWFMANSPRVPEAIRTRYAEWGLAGDEFTDTEHWPHQLYVREARRMVSDYVLTDHDCLGKRRAEEAVGMGAYNMDSHNCQRTIRDGRVINEGDVQIGLPSPYPVPYRAIVPRQSECTNLAVPVCVSASHIAFGSVRMEPVFMILAESATLAADLAIGADSDLQDVPYSELRPRLDAAGQVLACEVSNRSTYGNEV